MSPAGPPAPLLFSTFFGALMVLVAAGTGRGPVWIAGAVAFLAVLAGIGYRPAAAVAVLVTAGVLAWTAPPVLVVAVCGLSATAYLVIRHAAALTAPTLAGMAGGTLVAVLAAIVPWRVAWVPLLAPAVVVGLLVLAGAGLFREDPVRYE